MIRSESTAQGGYIQLDTDASSFKTSDLLILQSHRPSSWRERIWTEPRVQLRVACICFAFVCSLLSGALVVQAWRHRSSNGEAAIYSPECLLPLGGGPLNPGGSMPSFKRDTSWCKAQVQLYFNKRVGYYYKEVQTVADSAIAYFSELAVKAPPSPAHVVVFDIDETALSNAVEWMSDAVQQRPPLSAWLWGGPFNSPRPCPHSMRGRGPFNSMGRGPFNSTTQHAERVVSTAGPNAYAFDGPGHAAALLQARTTQVPHHQQSEQKTETQPTSVGAPDWPMPETGTAGGRLYAWDDANRPALEAVRSLYVWLYAHNFSVAFITGRRESARKDTAANLLSAGYGKQCPTVAGRNTSSPAGPRTPEPCYVALHLREENDTRLASVFKPERRRQLEAYGFTLVGNIGDQLSDLEGDAVASANYKLPNPVYYIM